jgi:hypothetical protein
MARTSFQNVIGGLICFLLVVLIALEIQRVKNAADCGPPPGIAMPTR